MPANAPSMPQPQPPRRRSILVIEDEPLLLDVIVSALRARGFEHGPANTPEVAAIFTALDQDGGAIEVLVTTVDAATPCAVSLAVRDDHDAGRPLGALTRRQVEVLRLVALGKTNTEIAGIRGTTIEAVDRTIARAFATLGIGGQPTPPERVEAARRATAADATGAPANG